MTDSGIKLSYEVADQITLLNLLDTYKDINFMISRFEEKKGDVSKHEIEDYEYHKKLVLNLKEIINYYGG